MAPGLAQAVGEDGAGRPGADDDVVEFHRDLRLRKLSLMECCRVSGNGRNAAGEGT